MSKFEKRLGYISKVEISSGTVVCDVEDKNTPQKEHSNCVLARTSSNSVSLPPIGTEVIVERIKGEKIITNIISSPGLNGIEAQKSKEGSSNGAASMSFVFTRDEGSTEESLTIQYNSSGYEVSIDVEGDIVFDAGGDVKVVRNGSEEVVSTESHTH